MSGSGFERERCAIEAQRPTAVTIAGTLTIAVSVTAAAGLVAVQPRSGLASLQTRAERTAYRETSRYDDAIAFLREVETAAPRIHVTTFG